MIKKTVHIKGMHCRSCEILVEDKLKELVGVERVDVSYKQKKAIVHSNNKISEKKLKQAVRKAGYAIGIEEPQPWLSKNRKDYEVFAQVMAIIAVLYLAYIFLGFKNTVSFKNFNSDSLPIIFLIGLTAGLSTCMALVGGIVLSIAARFSQNNPQTSSLFKFRPHIFFNVGRVVGFFILGGLIGIVGSVLQISPLFTGIMTIAIGGIMLLLGLQLIGLFPRLSSASISLPISLGKSLGLKSSNKETYSDKSAAALGAATFFLPCGFTQSMQLLAMASGSFFIGGTMMAVFALGTVPGLLGVGGIASVVKGDFARKFFVFSGTVVVLFALFNIQNGLNLTGVKTIISSMHASGKVAGAAIQEPQVVRAIYTQQGLEPWSIPVQAGVPTKLEIDVQANGLGCMSSMTIPGLDNRMYRVQKGSLLTFNLTAPEGKHNITCSMGMLHGSIMAN